VSNQDPPLQIGEGQEFLVIEALQRKFLIECANIVPRRGQAPPDPWTGHVRVKQKPHREEGLPAEVLKERIQARQLRYRPAILFQLSVDLPRELGCVGTRRTEMTIREERMIGRQRSQVVRVGAKQLGDFPNIQATSDDPRTARAATEGDSRVKPRLRGLLGQLLDHCTARSA
jgi:hypothetical protein